MNRQPRTLLTLLLVAAVLGTGWVLWQDLQPQATPTSTPRQQPPAAPVRGGTVTTVLRAEPRSFNRLVSRTEGAELHSILTQGKLVRINRATGELEPWLATAWVTSADGLTTTFTLRDGVQWSDGVPFSSADVTFSFEAALDPKSGSVRVSDLSVNGQPLRVTAPDARTVVVTFPAPFGPGIRLLDNLAMVPRHNLAEAVAKGALAEAWSAATPPGDMVGVGPFRLARYDAGQRLVYERNPTYWRKAPDGVALPYLDSVVVEIIPDQNTESLRLQAGQLDLTYQPARADDVAMLRPLATAGQLSLLELGVSTDPDAFFFNLRPTKWSADPRGGWLPRKEFRQAISHAVDREAFADTVFLGAAVPIWGPVTPGNTRWFSPNVPRYAYEQDAARKLLAELSLVNRDEDPWLEDSAGHEARFTLLTYQGSSVLERSVAVLRADLQAVGIAVDVVPLEFGALIDRMLKGDFDAIFFNFTATDLDPAMSKDFWFSSGSAHVWNIGQATPATEWEQQIDDLMTKQAASLDLVERQRLFADVQRIFAEQLPIIYFVAPRLYMGVSTRLTNLAPAVLRPQLLWSADTIAVRLAAQGSTQ